MVTDIIFEPQEDGTYKSIFCGNTKTSTKVFYESYCRYKQKNDDCCICIFKARGLRSMLQPGDITMRGGTFLYLDLEHDY